MTCWISSSTRTAGSRWSGVSTLTAKLAADGPFWVQ